MENAKTVRSAWFLTPAIMLFAAVVAAPAANASASDKVSEEIVTRASSEGSVLVLVGLKVAWQMEQSLSDDAIMTQRRAIDAVQSDLLAELSGTKYAVVRRYREIPGIALDVGSDALAVLKQSGTVINVLPDRPIKPAATQGLPEPMRLNLPMDNVVPVSVVPAELFTEATNTGAVLVLVGLKTPWSPEGPLSGELVFAQRQAIAAAQNYLIAELADTNFRITRRYEAIPGIALEVGLDALRVLAKSVAVTNVLRDRPVKARR
jgi:hypothetical protein